MSGLGRGNKSLRARALLLVAAGRGSIEVANELGVDRTTVWRWRRRPDFQEELGELQGQQRTELHDKVQKLANKAVDVLESVMDDAEAGGSARVQACRAALDLAGLGRGQPVQPATPEEGVETPEDVNQILGEIPLAFLERHVRERQAERPPSTEPPLDPLAFLNERSRRERVEIEEEAEEAVAARGYPDMPESW
jgi:transposase-like protein